MFCYGPLLDFDFSDLINLKFSRTSGKRFRNGRFIVSYYFLILFKSVIADQDVTPPTQQSTPISKRQKAQIDVASPT